MMRDYEHPTSRDVHASLARYEVIQAIREMAEAAETGVVPDIHDEVQRGGVEGSHDESCTCAWCRNLF